MNTGVTFQIRISDYEGILWYEKLFDRKPDFIPHEDFVEWEITRDAWLQVAVGEPITGNGPLRLGVEDINSERKRLMNVLNLQIEEVKSREGVPAAWCTFEDPYGNRIGLYQDL
ncbi:ornithine monooxygenase [Halobacillus litoralis]|uniref:Ornithine monooxygenase n=1 Tax=Halobacillus litoralis TaxID=45668 RepID=A0A410MIJ1_9BACI|nr:VOC family protein [Halobacillus litoralis]QAS54554.1 ornithine monooxygenase [Halobacillus litoralis]